MEAQLIYIARQVSNDKESMYCVPVTEPTVDPSPFSEDAITLDFSYDAFDAEDFVGTFWKKKTGFVEAGTDGNSYEKISAIQAYEAMVEYQRKINSRMDDLQDEAVSNAQEWVEDRTSDDTPDDDTDSGASVSRESLINALRKLEEDDAIWKWTAPKNPDSDFNYGEWRVVPSRGSGGITFVDKGSVKTFLRDELGVEDLSE